MTSSEPTTSDQLRPTPTDGYPSPTSRLQTATEDILRAHQPSAGTPPILNRNLHIQYLLRNLQQGFPERYTSQDASQTWLLFWTLQGFSTLGIGLDDRTKQRRAPSIDTLLAAQHPEGGFGGGPGQLAHQLPTFAAVSALAIAGRPGPGGGWDEIDRAKMYTWFLSLKQPDGSFKVSHDGEVDVRGLYCLLVCATLLNILTPELLAGVPEFLASCQTYEGGFGSASFGEWAFREDGHAPDYSAPRPTLGEAHGGYTYCATAAWALVQPYLRLYYAPTPAGPKPAPTISMRGLARWYATMQGGRAELGGLRGRTNKLVDGCYAWWVGGGAAVVAGMLKEQEDARAGAEELQEGAEAQNEGWEDEEVDDSLLNRPALQQYVLCAAQHPAGGLRDKPPKHADAYHTLYCLSGLSAAQHRVVPNASRRATLRSSWDADKARSMEGSATASSSDGEQSLLDELRRESFVSALSWLEEEGTEQYVGGAVNRVNATHPLFDLTVTHAEGIMAHFYGQTLPVRRPQPRPRNKPADA
ncbi:terpenoid cyclases/Protein prenyltransferase [Obba rivulosa]|uniref:Terpenoid cyclases/Protein prenyltransferase n=1 Tax=Obba rivulosa TaxID=1052685 RepID=A0A8E2AYW5_9APHY|nr:terpenoid cyclases/Protein prenyltransferase [Obba rivulosa]